MKEFKVGDKVYVMNKGNGIVTSPKYSIPSDYIAVRLTSGEEINIWKDVCLLYPNLALNGEYKAMTEFKVGDRVKILNCWNDKYVGKEGIISAIDAEYRFVTMADESVLRFFYPTSIKLVNPSPGRLVTRKEIVKGQYGHFRIDNAKQGAKGISIWLGEDGAYFTAQELRDAAKVFTEIADALEEK